MKHATYYIIPLMLLHSISCSNNSTEIRSEIDHIITPTHTISSHETLSSMIEESKIIDLEATKESLISNIYKIELFDNKFYVLDKASFAAGGKLLVFDEEGKYIRKIGNIGRARNEYVSLGGFAINQKPKEIILLDDTSQKLIIFDISGKFKRYIDLLFTARQVEILDDGSFLFATGGRDCERLIITDSNGVIKESLFGSNDKNSMILLNFFTKSEQDIIYRNYLNDTLYSVNSSNGVVASRFVDFGEKALTWDKFTSYNKTQRADIESYLSSYNCNLKYYSETDKFAWALFFASGKPQCLLYDKISQKTVTYDIDTNNDVTYDSFVPLIIGSNEEWFIAQNNPLSTGEYLENMELENRDLENNKTTKSDREQKIRKIIMQRADLCNPIISLIKYKNLK